MSYHLRVLHSLVKLSRSNQSRSARLTPAAKSDCSRSALLNRAGGTATALGDALDTLLSLGLIQQPSANGDEPLRLTLEGLAVGTAYAAQAAREVEAARAETIEEPVRVRRGIIGVRRERRSVPRTVASRAA